MTTPPPPLLSAEEAIRRLRATPGWAAAMRDSYLDEDVEAAARRFEGSGEFRALKELIGRVNGTGVAGQAVLDLGAGTGVATFAFARSGAGRVVALEPDPSPIVGQMAIRRCCGDLPQVFIVSGHGEGLPFPDRTFDIVYARQVLHHARELGRLVSECARVLKPGGIFLAAREHVVDDDTQLAAFLRAHPVHQLTGGEHAWKLTDYRGAIRDAGLVVAISLGPWDSIINAFPFVQSDEELQGHARSLLIRRLGALGRVAARVPGVEAAVWRRIDQPVPGRLHTFVCLRPMAGEAPRP